MSLKITFIDVNEERIAKFNSLISPDTAEAITLPETYAIGALCDTEEEGVYRPAGIIVFDLFREIGEIYPSAVEIKWLYVERENRRSGIGSRLVAQVAASVAGTGIRRLRCEMSPSLAKEGVPDFFATRGFRKFETFGNRIEGTVGSLLSNADPMKENSESISKLSDLPGDVFKREMDRKVWRNVIPNVEWLITKGAEWFDMDVSHAVASKGRIEMLFLVHKRASGSLQALVIRVSDGRTVAQDSCMMKTLAAARSEYGFNAQMDIACKRETDLSYLSEFFRDWNIRQLTRMITDIGKL